MGCGSWLWWLMVAGCLGGLRFWCGGLWVLFWWLFGWFGLVDVWGSGFLGVGLDWCLAGFDGGGSDLDFWWGFRWLWVVIWRLWVSILSRWVGIGGGGVGWFNFGDWLVVMVLELWW